MRKMARRCHLKSEEFIGSMTCLEEQIEADMRTVRIQSLLLHCPAVLTFYWMTEVELSDLI